jgi:hypothetical protein
MLFGHVIILNTAFIPRQFPSIIHLAANGSLIGQSVYTMPDGDLTPTSLVQITNGDIMLGAVVTLSTTEQVPTVMRLTEAGTMKWAKSYNFFSMESLLNLLPLPTGDVVGLTAAQEPTLQSLHLSIIDTAGTLTDVREFSTRSSYTATMVRGTGLGAPFTVLSRIAESGDTAPHIDITTLSSSLTGCNVAPVLAVTNTSDFFDTSLVFKYTSNTIATDSLPVILEPVTFRQTWLCAHGVDEVHEAEPPRSLPIFPNPALPNTYINVDVPILTQGMYELVMRDLTGREVYHTRKGTIASGEQIQLPTTGLASGVYTIELVDASSFANMWRGKVVVE